MVNLNKNNRRWQKQVNVNTKRMRQLMRDVRADVIRRTQNSQDLDAWLANLAPYTASNCFVSGSHADTVREIANNIAGVVNQTSLPRGSNAEILKGTMAEACMTMVTNVGEDIKTELRRIAVESYNNKLAPRETAQVIGSKIDSFSKARCQCIARTETCRAANLGNYLNAKENGAKSYSVICNEGCCEYCQEEYGCDESGGVGDTVYDIDDTANMPPFHPNCRCTPVWSMDPAPDESINENAPEWSNDDQEKYENLQKRISDAERLLYSVPQDDPRYDKLLVIIDDNKQRLKLLEERKKLFDEYQLKNNESNEPVTKTRVEPLPVEELNKLSFNEVADYFNVDYQGIQIYDYDNKKYHTFIEQQKNGKSLTIRIEDGAVKSYAKKGIAHPNEIIQECLKVPKAYKQETNEIWFKNTTQGVLHRGTKSGYDSLSVNTGGYNAYVRPTQRQYGFTEVDHRIIINPRYFKGASGKYSGIYEQTEGEITSWKKTLFHEFAHSSDLTNEIWNSKDTTRRSYQQEYLEIERAEPHFTWYANTAIEESYAEHGGYVSMMLANPSEQKNLIPISYYENGEKIKRKINFEEYKERYPRHYAYFEELITKGEL